MKEKKMFEWIIGFFIYYLIGFFYILFLPKEYKIDGYIIAVSIVSLFWPFVLLMRILGYIRIAFEAFIQKKETK